ncbi:competence type IV pilus minor pilin ComGG [Ferdinandcohnia sp. Marseille-Q9671]
MKNEHGFILPVTLAISFLFFLVFTFQVNAYLTEKSFSKETEEIMILENLMQLGIGDIRKELEDEVESFERSGFFTYPNGTITYNIASLTPINSKVTMTCTTKGKRKYSARFEYNYETKEMDSWIEIR